MGPLVAAFAWGVGRLLDSLIPEDPRQRRRMEVTNARWQRRIFFGAVPFGYRYSGFRTWYVRLQATLCRVFAILWACVWVFLVIRKAVESR